MSSYRVVLQTLFSFRASQQADSNVMMFIGPFGLLVKNIYIYIFIRIELSVMSLSRSSHSIPLYRSVTCIFGLEKLKT